MLRATRNRCRSFLGIAWFFYDDLVGVGSFVGLLADRCAMLIYLLFKAPSLASIIAASTRSYVHDVHTRLGVPCSGV